MLYIYLDIYDKVKTNIFPSKNLKFNSMKTINFIAILFLGVIVLILNDLDGFNIAKFEDPISKTILRAVNFSYICFLLISFSSVIFDAKMVNLKLISFIYLSIICALLVYYVTASFSCMDPQKAFDWKNFGLYSLILLPTAIFSSIKFNNMKK